MCCVPKYYRKEGVLLKAKRNYKLISVYAMKMSIRSLKIFFPDMLHILEGFSDPEITYRRKQSPVCFNTENSTRVFLLFTVQCPTFQDF